ncbi:MAG: LysR family transcriptional regulator [Bdellovibrionales bacterium]|nr:LysR family transcriptional regulator [Bdellovibrionales bacterium]
MFNFNHLYYFHLVSSCGGISKAARILCITPPSLSFQIKVLEQKLGFSLVKRSGRSLVITPDGQKVAMYCQRVFAPVDELIEFVNRRAPDSVATSRIGVSQGIERPFVAKLLSLILRGRKQASELASLVSGTHAEQMALLASHHIDVLLSADPISHEGGQTLGEFTFPVVAVCSPSYFELLKIDPNAALSTSLRKAPPSLLVPTEKFRLGVETEIFLLKNGLLKEVVFESDNLAGLIAAATESLGVALLPRPYVENEIKQGSLVLVSPQPVWQHKIYLSVQNSAPMHWISESLREQLDRLARSR